VAGVRTRAALVAAAALTGLLVAPTSAAGVAESTGTTLVATLPTTHPASASPSPSSATYADPRGDVWKTIDSDQSQQEATPDPGLVPTDVIRTRFRHLHSRVRLRMTFVDLQRVADPRAPVSDEGIRYYQVFVYVATSDGNGQYIYMAIGHNGAGKVTMHPFLGHGRTPCATSHAIDYREDWIRVGFPRTCLGDPEWVRLGVVIVAGVGSSVTCYEDAVTDGFAYARRSFLAVRLSARLYQA
jgi:hypothetical protein